MIWNFIGRPARKLLFGGEGYGFRGAIEGMRGDAPAFLRAEWYVMMLPLADAVAYVESIRTVPMPGDAHGGLVVALYRKDAGRVEVTAGVAGNELAALRSHFMAMMTSPWLHANLLFSAALATGPSQPGKPNALDFGAGAPLLMAPHFGFDIIEKGAAE